MIPVVHSDSGRTITEQCHLRATIQKEEDLLKTTFGFYIKSGAAPLWCAQDLNIHILKTLSSELPK
jgi:sugar diacid utilization regulator